MLLVDSDIVSIPRIVASRIKWGLSNRWKMPVLSGDPSRGTIFILDGVAGLQLAPHMFRAAIAGTDCSLATCYFDWHIGLPGDFLSDLVWLRRNRRQGLKLARIIRSHRRRYPDAPNPPGELQWWDGGGRVCRGIAGKIRPHRYPDSRGISSFSRLFSG